MNELMGMGLDSWRTLSAVGMVGAILLYGYRILCLVDLMRLESEKLTGNIRLIYAGLIIFIPLGIGGWLYEYVVKNKTVSPMFLFPFCIVVFTYIYGMSHILPNATQFNFDFIGW
jgi:hypothetical protein